jgi:hypothetical protein
MIIYLATNTVNGMQYVGATTRDTLAPRIREHIKYAERKTRTSGSFANAIRKYGRKNISFEVLERVSDLKFLGACEKKWISKLNTMHPNGYNIKTGGMPKEMPSVSRNKSYIVEGVKYESLMSLADAYNMCHHKLRHRLLRSPLKWSVEQALGLSTPPKNDPVKHSKSIEVQGKTFRSQAAAARYYGVPVKAFRLRMLKGWPLEEALGIKERPNQRRTSSRWTRITVQGTEYFSIAHAAEELGVRSGLVTQRLHRGWTKEQAFDLAPPPPIQKKGIEFLGYPSMKAAARKNNINLTTLCQRLERGWHPEEALLKPITPNDGSRGGH